MKLPSKKINFVLFAISLLLGTTGVILLSFLNEENIFYKPAQWMHLFFVIALGLLLAIGLQCKISNKFLKSVMIACFISYCFAISTSLFYSILTIGDDIANPAFCTVISFLPFIVLCPDYTEPLMYFLIAVYWLIFIFSFGLLFWRFGRIQSNKNRRLAQSLVVVVFGIVFNICYYLSLCAIIEAIAFGMMMNMQ